MILIDVDFHSRRLIVGISQSVFSQSYFSQWNMKKIYKNSKRHQMILCKVSQLFFASGTCFELVHSILSQWNVKLKVHLITFLKHLIIIYIMSQWKVRLLNVLPWIADCETPCFRFCWHKIEIRKAINYQHKAIEFFHVFCQWNNSDFFENSKKLNFLARILKPT